MAIAVAQEIEPAARSVHNVEVMAGNSTNAPNMHMAAAPASRNEPGSSSHAEYHGGWTTSPRSRRRPAAKMSAAAPNAGAARPMAQLVPTAPDAAPSRGWTPAGARSA